jgi:hypothetical protein
MKVSKRYVAVVHKDDDLVNDFSSGKVARRDERPAFLLAAGGSVRGVDKLDLDVHGTRREARVVA